jgi:hypothetical protein
VGEEPDHLTGKDWPSINHTILSDSYHEQNLLRVLDKVFAMKLCQEQVSISVSKKVLHTENIFVYLFRARLT